MSGVHLHHPASLFEVEVVHGVRFNLEGDGVSLKTETLADIREDRCVNMSLCIDFPHMTLHLRSIKRSLDYYLVLRSRESIDISKKGCDELGTNHDDVLN